MAGEDLAVVTGRGEPALADIDGLRPYVLDADVVAYGEREGEPAAETIRVLDLDALRAGACALPSAPVLAARRRRRARPSTRSTRPRPGGMTFDELAALLQRLRGGAVGVQVTVFDPDLDPDGSIGARRSTDCLVRGL